MSKTPRTDELSRLIEGYAYVPATFARQLERELGEAKDEIEDLKTQIWERNQRG